MDKPPSGMAGPAAQRRLPEVRVAGRRTAAVVVAAALVIAACTGPDAPPQASATSTPSTPPQSPSPTPANAAVDIEFPYEAPDPACPPVDVLAPLPSATEHPYVEAQSSVSVGDELQVPRILVICRYEPAESAEDETVVLAADHLRVAAQLTLFPSWEESYWPDVVPELPVGSDDLDDWLGIPALDTRDRGVWRETCGDGTSPCADGEEPTAQNSYRYTSFRGHVGNLQFDMSGWYIAEDLPPDTERAERLVVAALQRLVLAVVDSWEHAE